MENKQEIQNRVIDAIMGHSSENVEDYGETYEYNIDFAYNDPEIITLHSRWEQDTRQVSCLHKP